MCLIHEMLERSAADFPDNTVIRAGGEDMSFSRLAADAARLKDVFIESGVRKGDRIGVYLEKSYEEAAAVFGACMSGAVFVMINPALKETQFLHIIRDAGIKVLVTHPLKIRSFETKLNGIETVILTDAGPKNENFRTFDFSDSPKKNYEPPYMTESDIAAILYTSGSTGLAKGVVLTHRNITSGAESVARYLGITGRDRILSALPFSFDYGLNQLMTAVLTGAPIVLTKFLSADALVDLIHAEQITGLAGIPTLWARFLEAGGLRDRPFSSLRYITNSGGKLTRGQVEELRKALPSAKIFLMYGLTEAFRATYLDPAEIEKRPESIGKAVPNAEVFVIDESGKECAPGAVGELIQRGPLVSRGYWNRPDETALKIRQNPLVSGYLDPVCYSGDLVFKDEEGYLFFVGRKDNMIKTSGNRISPQEVEDGLLSFEAVKEAVSFGVPDDVLGQRIVAVVSFKTKHDDETLKSLRGHCLRILPSYMVPSEIHPLDAMPLMGNGKINRRQVIETFLKKE